MVWSQRSSNKSPFGYVVYFQTVTLSSVCTTNLMEDTTAPAEVSAMKDLLAVVVAHAGQSGGYGGSHHG